MFIRVPLPLINSIAIALMLAAAASLLPRSTPPSRMVIHVIVALCDNDYQGIVPVPKRIGNGDDPANNLYWGAAYGVRSFFRNAKEWEHLADVAAPRVAILQRSSSHCRSPLSPYHDRPDGARGICPPCGARGLDARRERRTDPRACSRSIQSLSEVRAACRARVVWNRRMMGRGFSRIGRIYADSISVNPPDPR